MAWTSSLMRDVERLARLGRIRELIEMGRDEKSFNRLLASALGAEANRIVRGVEADILRGDEALEVKIRPSRFFSGFCQAVALEIVAGLRSAGLFHIVDRADEDYLGMVRAMSRRLGIKLIIYSLSGNDCVVIWD